MREDVKRSRLSAEDWIEAEVEIELGRILSPFRDKYHRVTHPWRYNCTKFGKVERR